MVAFGNGNGGESKQLTVAEANEFVKSITNGRKTVGQRGREVFILDGDSGEELQLHPDMDLTRPELRNWAAD